MAEKRTINIDINNNADETAKDFDTLNKSIDQTTKSTKNLDATFEEVYGDLQPLTSRMGEAEDRLYELSLAGDTTSKEFQELLTKVGQYRKVQIQTDIAVDGAAKTMTQKLGSALTGATSGFALAQGSMALFGSENEALEKSLLKVQGAMAIQQGVQGLSDSYKELQIGTKLAAAAQYIYTTAVGASTGGMKLFRLALVSTGIGALVVGIGLLIANFDKVKEVLSDVNKGFKEGSLLTKALMLAFAPLILTFKAVEAGLYAVISAYYAITDALGITSKAERQREQQAKINSINAQKRAAIETEIAKKRKKEQQERIKEIHRVAKAEKMAFDQKLRLLESEGKSTLRIRKKRLKDALDEAQELFDIEKRTGGFLLTLRKNALNEAQIAYNNILSEQRDSYQKYNDNLNAIDEKRKAANQQELDEEIDAEMELFKQLEAIRLENEAKFRTEQENELLAVEEKYDSLQASAYGNAEALEDIEIARLQANNDINLQYANEAYDAQKAIDDKAAADQKVRDDKAKADAQALADAKIDIGVKGLQLIAGIADAFAGDDVKRQKKAFQIKKAADIAAATVDGYRAVLSTYAQTPGGIVLKTIAATIAGGFAALQIGNIASAEFGGGGGDVESSASAGGGEVSAPSFNVVGDSGINQLASLQQQPVQAFVVSGEVTTSQALDRNRVENATL